MPTAKQPWCGSIAKIPQQTLPRKLWCTGSSVSTGSSSISFSPAFGGNKVVYLAAGDSAGNNSGWRPAGVMSVPLSSLPNPAIVSLAPNDATGLNVAYVLTVRNQPSATKYSKFRAVVAYLTGSDPVERVVHQNLNSRQAEQPFRHLQKQLLADDSFTPQRSPSPAALPDGRRWAQRSAMTLK